MTSYIFISILIIYIMLKSAKKKLTGEQLSKLEKLCVLSFDETYVSKRICYDKKKEQFLGPHRCVQVAMIRGKF